MNKAELLIWLNRYIEFNYKTQRAFCHAFDFNERNMSEILQGARPVPKRLLRSLNIKTLVLYQLGTPTNDYAPKNSRRISQELLNNSHEDTSRTK